jgi:hypothetical protein
VKNGGFHPFALFGARGGSHPKRELLVGRRLAARTTLLAATAFLFLLLPFLSLLRLFALGFFGLLLLSVCKAFLIRWLSRRRRVAPASRRRSRGRPRPRSTQNPESRGHSTLASAGHVISAATVRGRSARNWAGGTPALPFVSAIVSI